jgi:hypothetical protein
MSRIISGGFPLSDAVNIRNKLILSSQYKSVAKERYLASQNISKISYTNIEAKERSKLYPSLFIS